MVDFEVPSWKPYFTSAHTVPEKLSTFTNSTTSHNHPSRRDHCLRLIPHTRQYQSSTMAPSNLPPIFNATSQDVEMLLAAQCHLGSKNLQVHMEPYLWKTRPDGINVINIGKTW